MATTNASDLVLRSFFLSNSADQKLRAVAYDKNTSKGEVIRRVLENALASANGLADILRDHPAAKKAAKKPAAKKAAKKPAAKKAAKKPAAKKPAAKKAAKKFAKKGP